MSMLARQAAAGRAQECDWSALVGRFRSASSPHVDDSARWNTLVLPEALKTRLKTTCSLLADVEGGRAMEITAPAGILLVGPPGTGKTQIASTIANECGMGFVKASSADLFGLYIGHSASNVRDLFEKARALRRRYSFSTNWMWRPKRDTSAGGTFTVKLSTKCCRRRIQSASLEAMFLSLMQRTERHHR